MTRSFDDVMNSIHKDDSTPAQNSVPVVHEMNRFEKIANSIAVLNANGYGNNDGQMYFEGDYYAIMDELDREAFDNNNPYSGLPNVTVQQFPVPVVTPPAILQPSPIPYQALTSSGIPALACGSSSNWPYGLSENDLPF